MLSPIPASVFEKKSRVQFDKKGDEERVSAFTRTFLEDIALSCNILLLRVTSTTRTAQEQAVAMYDKVKHNTFDSYKAAGAAVQDVARSGIAAGSPRDAVIRDMLTEIDKVGFINVSQHAGVIGLNVVDIAPSTMTTEERRRFISAVRRRFGAPVYKFGYATGPKPGTKFEFRDNDCFHVAIMQPEDLDVLSRIV